MSFLSGVVGVVEQAALAYATGGASLAVEEVAGQVLQSAMSEGLSSLGGQLGLSQDETDGILQSAGLPTGSTAADTATEAGSDMGFSPSQQADLANTAQQATDSIRQMLEQGLQEAGGDSAKAARGGGKGGMSVLEAIAYAMGAQMDKKLDDMVSMANQLGSTSTQSSQYGKLTSMIQAEGQELSMLSNAVNNAIKSIGDAGSTMAKKD